MKTATRDSWKILPMPEIQAFLSYTRCFSVAEYEKLLVGLIPGAIENKWFCFLKEETLYFHRSWTGHCIYKIHFEKTENGFCIKKVIANRDKEQYKENDDNYDTKMLDFLISNLLLGESKPFPHKRNINEPMPGVMQHHIAGTRYSEVEHPDKKSWWKFWK